MSGEPKRIAVFAGTFDPLTNGHLDVIERGRHLFDELVVAVGDNPDKPATFTPAERVEMVRLTTADMPNVRAEAYTGLTVDFARHIGAAVILRGMRNSADLLFEYQVAMTNRAVAGVETVFILTSAACSFLSSSLVRQIARMGGDVSAFVPPAILPRIQQRYR